MTDPMILIPGDNARISVRVRMDLPSSYGSPGRVRVRFELKTVVPVPSAAVSLPIGVVTLAGLASLKK